MLSVKNVSKRYKGTLFQNISFTLEAGQGLGIIGGNGSGKTTLLNIIAGLERADVGEVSFDGALGYVMQADGLMERLSARDNLRFACKLHGVKNPRARIAALAEMFALEDFLDKKLSKCSFGMRQRVNIAAALVSEPRLLALDEATGSLDAASREVLLAALAALKSRGAALLMVSHYKEELAGLCEFYLNLETGAFSPC